MRSKRVEMDEESSSDSDEEYTVQSALEDWHYGKSEQTITNYTNRVKQFERFLAAFVATVAIAIRRRTWSWPWAGAALACLAVVVAGFGMVDFRGFGGGGH